MITKLRRRFIIVAMVSVCAVLTVIIGTVNILNYKRVITEADRVVQVLADHGGVFPQENGKEKGFPQEEISQEEKKDGGKPDVMRGFSPELPFETRYFTVTFDTEGAVLSTDTKKIAAIDADEVLTYAREAQSSGKEKGFAGQYRFGKAKTEEGTLFVFVDCRISLDNFMGFAGVSAGVSLAGLAAVFLLVVYFSGKVFLPVEQSYQKQKRFITDAGHELKTPLTIIDANVEVLEMENGESAWTESIRNQTKRLAGLTADLVTLARLEEEHTAAGMVDFSFSDAVCETLDSFQASAKAGGKTLDVRVEPNLTMHGNEEQIRQLMTILVENSMKYCPDGGQISVTLKKKGRTKQLVVVNDAQNIPEGSLEQLFDRFYRGDPSRNSGTGGYGIGLSIAKAIVESHRGRISAAGEKGERFCITVIFPGHFAGPAI